MIMKQIYADFVKMDYESRLVLTCTGTRNDLETQNIILEDGMRLVFYNHDEDEAGNSDNLVVEDIVGYDKGKQRWVANINWDEIKNISKLSFQDKQKLGIE